MDTLKMKIGLLKRENNDSSSRMAVAEKTKVEAEERIGNAEKQIREISKLIHARKILVDEKTDQHQRNQNSARRKEEATLAAKEEINSLNLREMALKSELERMSAALPATSENLCDASEQADRELGEVKKLEIRAMLADQTIEEMEQQMDLAQSMAVSTNHKAEEMLKKLELRQQELNKAQERAERAQTRLNLVNEKLKSSDRKMAGLQYTLEDRGRVDLKYKKQVHLLQARLNDAAQRAERELVALRNIKQNVEVRTARAASRK